MAGADTIEFRFLAAWDQLASELGAPELLRSVGADLAERHREPHRHYHSQEHVLAVLDHLGHLDAASPVSRLAAFFHDAIYDPTRGDNEKRSADLAAQALAGVDFAGTDAVVRVIEATATHSLGDDAPAETAAFLDADLAILGASPKIYDRYAAAIRSEYAHVPDPDFRLGRQAVLEHFLERDRLYFTPGGRDTWESAARANLTRELGRLS